MNDNSSTTTSTTTSFSDPTTKLKSILWDDTKHAGALPLYFATGPPNLSSSTNVIIPKERNPITEVFLSHEPPKWDGAKLKRFFQSMFAQHGLLQNSFDNPIQMVHPVTRREAINNIGNGKWCFRMVSEEMAERLLYFHGMRHGSSGYRFFFQRNVAYRNRPQRYKTYEEFSRAWQEEKRIKREQQQILLQQRQAQAAAAAATTTASGSSSVENGLQQTHGIDQNSDTLEPTTTVPLETENSRLRKEICNLAKQLESVKGEFGTVAEKYAELQAVVDMEAGFCEAMGTEHRPIELDSEDDKDDDKKDENQSLQQTKSSLSTKAEEDTVKKQEEAATILLQNELIKQLQQELLASKAKEEAEHAIVIAQQQEIEQLRQQKADTEQQFKDVTKTLTMQTSELINVSHAKRSLEDLLCDERKEHRETKKKLKEFTKKVKSEADRDWLV